MTSMHFNCGVACRIAVHHGLTGMKFVSLCASKKDLFCARAGAETARARGDGYSDPVQ